MAGSRIPSTLESNAWHPVLALLRRLPQAALSRAFGRVADLELPKPLRRPLLGAAARLLGIDLGEAERPLEDYESLNRLFVRRLRSGARSWPHDPDAVCSPVDGVLGTCGTVTGGRLIQAKGIEYSTGALLGSADEGRRFADGSFLTLYLSPRHYHRIHSPVGGVIAGARHLPGCLLPVNRPAVHHVADLFARNERLLCHIDGALGRVTVVAVGAYNVGRISARFEPDWYGDGLPWVTNRPEGETTTRLYDPPLPVGQGEEIMAFHLGSTVILLSEPGRVRIDPSLCAGDEVRCGQVLARGRAGESGG